MKENKLAIFEKKEIRREWYKEDWYFSVEDVVQILTNSVDVKQYIKKLKTRDKELKGISKTKRNLRDNMGKLELAITNLTEVTANEIHNANNSLGLVELKDDVQVAGEITGKARK